MDIKLVAVDMDGTFLRQIPTYDDSGAMVDVEMDYDQEMFEEVMKRLRINNGNFVVASGNQYYQLKSFFPGLDDKITYVAENGAYIVEKGEEVYSVKIQQETLDQIIEILDSFDHVQICVCGKDYAYVLYGDEQYRDFINLFYHRLKEVENFKNLDDQILKIALNVPYEKSEEIFNELSNKVGHLIQPVDSGHGCIDLIVPGVHKGAALELLCKRWNINDSQCAAFGDGGNDLEMIRFVKYGYAMENAKQEIKDNAYAICESNNDQGVLKTLIKIL